MWRRVTDCAALPIPPPSAVPAPVVVIATDPGLDAPCAGIGAHLRCVFGDLSAAPLPNKMAELTAKLEAACSGGGRRRS